MVMHSTTSASDCHEETSTIRTRYADSTNTVFVQVNYKILNGPRQADPSFVRIPEDMFEGPAQECCPLFLKDILEEFVDMTTRLTPRQLELWSPKHPLDLKNAYKDMSKDVLIVEDELTKIMKPLSLSSQISVDNNALLHLFVTIKRPGIFTQLKEAMAEVKSEFFGW